MDLTTIQIVLGILKALFGFTVLIVAHELGHFLVAKKLGVWAEEFGIGLPPKVWGKKIGETLWSVNALPIGGFVRMHGESHADKVTFPKRAFTNKSKLARALIALAGVAANFLLAVFLFSISFTFSGEGIIKPNDIVTVVEVAIDSPAQRAGVLVGDIVQDANDIEINSTDGFISFVSENKNKKIALTILRNDETLDISLKPREDHPASEGPVGVVISSGDVYYPPTWQRPFIGVQQGLTSTYQLTREIILSLSGVATSVTHGKAPEGVVGPAGIMVIIFYFANLGIIPFINLIAMISVNLAVINLVPFPPLDGSRVLLLGFEQIFGKKAIAKIEGYVFSGGMIILLSLMVYMTIKEIPKIINAGGAIKFVETIISVQ